MKILINTTGVSDIIIYGYFGFVALSLEKHYTIIYFVEQKNSEDQTYTNPTTASEEEIFKLNFDT